MSEEKPWEEDFGEEEQLLLQHGFFRRCGLGDDVWQLGSSGQAHISEAAEPKLYTREQALKFIEERRDKGE